MKTIILNLLLLSYVLYPQAAISEKIFALNWGNSPTEVGLQIDDEAYGPKNFNVDKNENIYIADFIQNKIKKFGKNLELIFQITLKPRTHIASLNILNDNRILYDDGREYFIVDKDGQHQQRLPHIKIAVRFIDQRGDTLFLCDTWGKTMVTDNNFKVIESLSSKTLSLPNSFVVNNQIIFLKFDRSESKYIFKKAPYEHNKTLAKSFASAKDYQVPTEGLVDIEGIDKQGNIYISKKLSASTPFIFQKYNSEFKKVSEVQINWKIYHSVVIPFRITPDGDLLVMNSDKKGIWIDKYPAKLFQ